MAGKRPSSGQHNAQATGRTDRQLCSSMRHALTPPAADLARVIRQIVTTVKANCLAEEQSADSFDCTGSHLHCPVQRTVLMSNRTVGEST